MTNYQIGQNRSEPLLYLQKHSHGLNAVATLRYITPPKAPSFTPGSVSLPHTIIYNISYTYLQKDSNVGQPQRGFNPLANPIFDSPVYFDLFIQ